MKRFRKYAVYLALGMAVAALAVGCKKKPKETESEPETMTETVTGEVEDIEVKTGTATEKTKLYTSRDKTISINLPGSSWRNTKDTADTLVFEAAEGSITITHLSGSDVSSVKLPATKEEVLENFKTAGKNAEDYEVTEFKKTGSGTNAQYHTVIKCSDPDEDYVYSVGYDIAGSSDIYSVTGLVKNDDEEALEAIRTAVESFKVLKRSSTTDKTGETSGSSGDSQSGGDSPTGTAKVIYDSNGNPITVVKGEDGTWKDSSGKSYDMQQYGVMGSDGYWYTYQAPSGAGNSTGNNNDNNGTTDNNNNDDNNSTGNNGGTAAETNGFFDADGNYITVTKDANGNWTDSYGTVYYFGESGVTDNAGNYYPYKDSSETTGFYNGQGQYITVTKDSNGNWVDSSGAKYVFGDTGVTDEAGNFYPY